MAELRKIAIVGSARIPFTRAYTGYANETNLSMLTAALAGIADKFGLKGEAVNEVMGGAVISHSRRFAKTSSNLAVSCSSLTYVEGWSSSFRSSRNFLHASSNLSFAKDVFAFVILPCCISATLAFARR